MIEQTYHMNPYQLSYKGEMIPLDRVATSGKSTSKVVKASDRENLL